MTRKAETRTVTVKIEGRVQGVYYRAWTDQTARSLGLDGWVRNASDGSVEAVFSGPAETVADMLERCKDGPRDAKVTAVTITRRRRRAAVGLQGHRIGSLALITARPKTR